MMNKSENATAVIACEALIKSYRQGPQTVEVLKGIDLTLVRGEKLAIIGASGAGKSTLLNLLGGLDLPDAGKIEIDGHDLFQLDENQRGRLRNTTLGFVYQFHHLLPEFSAVENVAMPLLIARVAPDEALNKAMSLLEKVGLSERASHKPSELSGGERQRVAIARSLAMNPACVLMDEPTGNLDRHTAAQIHDLMHSLNRDFNTSFVIVTHDPQLAAQMDRVLLLDNGQLQPAVAEA